MIIPPMAKPLAGQASALQTLRWQGWLRQRIDSFHQQKNLKDILHRQAMARGYAEQFCKVTIDGDSFGFEEKAIKRILKDVHRLRLHAEFNQAVLARARKQGQTFHSVADLLAQVLASNPVTKHFKNAVRKECLDYLYFGKNFYRPTAWDYRLYGMYRSIADFAAVCKQHPVMSTSVIGAVAILGHLYPFVGAVSGVAILAWAGMFTTLHEILARQHGLTKADRAAHYKASGENMAAFAITSIGGKGIKEGLQNGMKVYRSTVSEGSRLQEVNGLSRSMSGLWQASKARPTGEHKTNALESFLFVSGLFDNVLLPFNWLADKVEQKPCPK